MRGRIPDSCIAFPLNLKTSIPQRAFIKRKNLKRDVQICFLKSASLYVGLSIKHCLQQISSAQWKIWSLCSTLAVPVQTWNVCQTIKSKNRSWHTIIGAMYLIRSLSEEDSDFVYRTWWYERYSIWYIHRKKKYAAWSPTGSVNLSGVDNELHLLFTII